MAYQVARGFRPMRRLFWRVTLWVVLAFGLIWGSTAVVLWRAYHGAEYPGATQISADDLMRYRGNMAFTRIETYRTLDAFNTVYKWYSVGFDLGPERFAQSNCMLMARSAQVAGPLSMNMSVMVCSNSADRMIFVTRTYTLRVPDLVRRLT